MEEQDVPAQDGDDDAVGPLQRDVWLAPDLLLVGVPDGEHDGERHVDEAPVGEADAVEVEALEVLVLVHEPAERAGPSLGQHVRPLEVDGGEAHPRERLRLRAQRRDAVGRGDELDERAAVRVDERAADRHGAAPPVPLGGGGGARVRGGEAEAAGEEERVRERRGGADASRGGGGGGGVVEAGWSELVGGGHGCARGVRPRGALGCAQAVQVATVTRRGRGGAARRVGG